MLRVLIALLILLIAIFLGTQLHQDPGYVLIAINHWTIETTLGVAVFILIILFLSAHIFLKLCRHISSIPRTISQWNIRRLTSKAQETTRQGLIEYSEGYWEKAQNHLIKALPHIDTPLLNYLTAARAAQKMGNSQLRDHYLREAQQSMPEAKIAVELTQAQLQLANNQWEQALATLRHLQDLAPKHPYVLKLLMHLYQEVRDWTPLIHLLPDLKKNKIISEEEFERLQKNTYLHAINDLIKQKQSTAITALFHSLPKTLAFCPEITREYATYLIKKGDLDVAEEHLRQCLRKKFNPALIEIYSTPIHSETQLLFAETLLKKNADSSSLLLCLGRLCIAQQLWGKAKQYLERSLELTPSAQAYHTLGELYEQLNEPLKACAYYKKGLDLTANR